MAPITQADIDSASHYFLGGPLDPRVNGLDAAKGALYVFANGGAPVLLQKQSESGGDPLAWNEVAGGGGGGGQIPVVEVDPLAPALNEQWILRVPPTGGGGITGSIAGPPLMGQFVVSVNSVIPHDLQQFTTGDPMMGPWKIRLQKTGAIPPNTVNFQPGPSPFGLLVQYNPAGPGQMNLGGLVNNTNTWAMGSLSPGVAPIASLTNPMDSNLDLFGFPGIIDMNLASAGTPESYTLKVQGSTKVFTVPLG